MREARLSQILDVVGERGHVSVADLNDVLGVSEATIRRDLDHLSELGQLRRTHGGAVRLDTSDREPPHEVRRLALDHEKRRIGRAAADLISDGDRLYLSSGTTVAAIAPHLRGKTGLTVVTNSLAVINELAGRATVELIVIGGVFRHTEGSVISELAEQMILRFRVDKVFMGVRAIDPEQGLTSDSVAEASVDRAALSIGRQRIVVADHTKLGKVSMVTLGPASAVQLVITDAIEPSVAAEFQAQGVEVLVAE